ncbi:hypothetical protein DIS24_g11122 [Lasiodiplodia hormozganensis]|uniref:DUF6594 domain-containing protein n=1 Tax=Lasiodiplodia hormozganensis TaxID=869390 RepID=A0AA39X1K5_9PEZI|nr:hypothetical protein DIS24_g11122 [Lasiodiplodia hormozganensis]
MTAAASASKQASVTPTTAARNSPSAGPSTVSASAIHLPASRSPSRGSEVAAATTRDPSRSSLEALMAIQPASPREAASTARQQGGNVGGGSGGGGGGLLPAGYPSLARRMASMPEASIFRSFASLNIRNLLYMQAELVCLEDELNRYQLEDARAGQTRQKYANN